MKMHLHGPPNSALNLSSYWKPTSIGAGGSLNDETRNDFSGGGAAT